MKILRSTIILSPLFITILGILGAATLVFRHEIIMAIISLLISILLIIFYQVFSLKISFFTKNEFIKIQNIAIALSSLLLFIGIYHRL